MGLATRPASAACTLLRILISPVPLFTATLKPCTLKATERGVPPELPLAHIVLPCAAAACASSANDRRLPPQTAALSLNSHEAAGVPAAIAANALMSPARVSAATFVAS